MKKKKKNMQTYEEIIKNKNDFVIKYFKDVYWMIADFVNNSKKMEEGLEKKYMELRDYVDKDLLCHIGHRDINFTKDYLLIEIDKYDEFIEDYIGQLLYYGYLLCIIKKEDISKDEELYIVNRIFEGIYVYYYNDFLGANLIKVFFLHYMDFDDLRYQLKKFIDEKGDNCKRDDLVAASFLIDKDRYRYIK